MTIPDDLNLVGIVVTALGASLGMVGIICQTNGYYAFRSFQIFEQLLLLAKECLRFRFHAAWSQIQLTVLAAEKIHEDRAKALVGLYLVLLGFILQSLGSLLLLTAIFVQNSHR